MVIDNYTGVLPLLHIQQLWPCYLSWHCVAWLSPGMWWDCPSPSSMVQALLKAGLHGKPLWLWNLFLTASECVIQESVCPVQRVPSLSMGYMFNSPPNPPAGISVCVWVCKLDFTSKKRSFTIPFRRTQIHSSIWFSRVQKSICVNGDCSAYIWCLLFGCKSCGKSRSVQLILNLLCQSYSLI